MVFTSQDDVLSSESSSHILCSPSTLIWRAYCVLLDAALVANRTNRVSVLMKQIFQGKESNNEEIEKQEHFRAGEWYAENSKRKEAIESDRELV